MPPRKRASSKPLKQRIIGTDEYEIPEPPELRAERRAERAWRLRHATRDVWACLDKATTAVELKAFWVARRADINKAVIKVEFPKFIESTWSIMRTLADETGVDIPSEPSIGHHATLVEAYYNGERISVDMVLLRNIIDQIVTWCRQAEAEPPLKKDQGARKCVKQKNKGVRGRQIDTDPKAEKQVYEAWKSHHYDQYDDLALELGKPRREIHLAIDRHRKRLKRLAGIQL